MIDRFVALSSAAAIEWSAEPQIFSAWIHLARAWREDDAALVRNLIDRGCRYFMVSGVDAESVHHLIDDIAIAQSQELVLTSARSNLDEDTAGILSYEVPGSRTDYRLITALADGPTSELPVLAKMCELAGAVDEQREW